jgi:hypothetical protein
MAAQVGGDDTPAGRRQGVGNAGQDEVELRAGEEAVQQDRGPAFAKRLHRDRAAVEAGKGAACRLSHPGI